MKSLPTVNNALLTEVVTLANPVLIIAVVLAIKLLPTVNEAAFTKLVTKIALAYAAVTLAMKSLPTFNDAALTVPVAKIAFTETELELITVLTLELPTLIAPVVLSKVRLEVEPIVPESLN